MLPALRNNSLVPATFGAPVNRIASLFDRFFNDDFFRMGPMTASPTWTSLPLSLWEDEHNVYVEVDAPGVTDKDIDLAVHQGHLILRWERKCSRAEGVYDTRRYGQFQQRIALPTGVDADKVEAKLANGVLTVILPKSDEAKPRKIRIQSE